MSLEADVLYENSAVPSLAAALFRLKRAQAAADVGSAGDGGGGDSGSGAAADEDESVPLLLVEASECVRCGELRHAEALCLRAAALAGLRDECWRVRLNTPDEDLPAVPRCADAPLLAMLLGVWTRMGDHKRAAAACLLLLRVRAQGAAGAHSIDLALLCRLVRSCTRRILASPGSSRR